MYNNFLYLLNFRHIRSTCVFNMLTNFLTSTMKFRQLMARIDISLKVTSPFTRIGILANPINQDEMNKYQKLFIFDFLNISIKLMTKYIKLTILTIYEHINVPTFDDGANCLLSN